MPCITYHCGAEHKRRVLIVGGQFSGNFTARDLKRAFYVTVVDAKEYFEYTPGILRAYVKPAHFDALTFTLQPVYERKMGVKFIWGEVKKLNENDAQVKPIYLDQEVTLKFDYCIICSGCNFGPFMKPPGSMWHNGKETGESLWFGVVHEQNRKHSDWKHIDERFIEGRRRHILEEYHTIAELERNNSTILVVGAGFIGVEWATELEHFFPNLEIVITDMLPNCLGPLPKIAADYCVEYMDAVGIHQFYEVKGDFSKPKSEFYAKLNLPADGPAKEYICVGVKSSNYFMPQETLSTSGPGGGGWIHFNEAMQVTERPKDGETFGKLWAKGRIFAVGDCNYGCIPKPGAKDPGDKSQWILPPIPKISYPGEEQALHAIWNVERLDSHLYGNHGCRKLCCRRTAFRKTWWPWGAGMFATSLGPHDACFVMAANTKKHSGYMVNWWIPAALQKEIIESSKIDECKDHVVGKLIWHFVHHTPFHLWGAGQKFNYFNKFTPIKDCK